MDGQDSLVELEKRVLALEQRSETILSLMGELSAQLLSSSEQLVKIVDIITALKGGE